MGARVGISAKLIFVELGSEDEGEAEVIVLGISMRALC